jgi:hypothetical protein
LEIIPIHIIKEAIKLELTTIQSMVLALMKIQANTNHTIKHGLALQIYALMPLIREREGRCKVTVLV